MSSTSDNSAAADHAGAANGSGVAAGSFGQWLEQFTAALRGSGGTEVPCGDCTGCCTSGYSVQLRREDARAAAKIPERLLVRAPGVPANDRMMPPLANGHCPMLHAGKCSIYNDRPQTCLDYDCRVFAAAGIDAGGADKVVINRRVREWRFSYSNEAERAAHLAIRATAQFIQKRHDCFPAGHVPRGPSGIAVFAVKAHAAFLDPRLNERSDSELAHAVLEAGRQFDAGA